MADIQIREDLLPRLDGKVALITGGASGIGEAAARILLSKGATVHIVCLEETIPSESSQEGGTPTPKYHACDVRKWKDLRRVFADVGHVDLVFANAGVSQTTDFFTDFLDADGLLAEPEWKGVIETNFVGVLNTVKLAWSTMRANKTAGSIVITASATGYSPEQCLPIYSASKAAVLGLIRSLRSMTATTDPKITINGVAPAATVTGLLPPDLAAPIIAMGLPVSTAHFVGLALVYSATAMQERSVEIYGRETEADDKWRRDQRWNGRVILTLGDRYTEIEEPLSDLRSFWFGRDNHEMTRRQQKATDFRGN